MPVDQSYNYTMPAHRLDLMLKVVVANHVTHILPTLGNLSVLRGTWEPSLGAWEQGTCLSVADLVSRKPSSADCLCTISCSIRPFPIHLT